MPFKFQRSLRTLAAASLLMIVAACGDSTSSDAATRTAESGKKTTVAAVKPPAGQDWTQVVAATPEGGFRMGNPNAPVKLVEFASLSCPHCRDFHATAMAQLKRDYVAPGRVSYEFRNFILNTPDVAASLLARCDGASSFYKFVDAFYTGQETWLKPFLSINEADEARLKALPADQQIAAYAAQGGLDNFVRLRGMPKAKFQQCLMNRAELGRLAKIRSDTMTSYPNFPGTPTFVINGEMQQDTATWDALKPKLDAAL